MPPISTLPNANRRTLKRSFTAITVAGPSSERIVAAKISQISTGRSTKGTNPSKAQLRRRDTAIVPLGMATASGPNMYEKHVPYLSLYSIDSSAPNISCWSSPTSTISEIPGAKYTENLPNRSVAKISRIEKSQTDISSSFHLKFKSESVMKPAFDSPVPSPTTTISTVDSLLSDPSSISSPKSPIDDNNVSLSANAISELENFSPIKITNFVLPRLSSTDERPMTSPSLKKKNPKSLALNLSPSMDGFHGSESSLCFIKPPALRGKKKPSLLSLNTGAANNTMIEPPPQSGVPTMLQRRSLKHSISSPLMVSTPKLGPAGGMSFRTQMCSRLRDRETLPVEMDEDRIQEEHYESPTGVQMATRLPGFTVGGDAFDRAHSGGDPKSTGYPNGPILMYEPNIYLYSEPKPEEAMEFDVIINVAREVKCPFRGTEHDNRNLRRSTSHSAIETSLSSPSYLGVIPNKSTVSVGVCSSNKSSPSRKFPEYIHIPWDHSTDVKDELWDLCQLIESRVRKGKKVLIHCQQGASRSATLIIAYGMYMNQDMGPNEVYQLAQSRSQWVNPNMSLLFSLNDFKKLIEEKKIEKTKISEERYPKPITLTPTSITESRNGKLVVLESIRASGSLPDSDHSVEPNISRSSLHEDKMTSKSETNDIGLTSGSSNREWKKIVFQYVGAINLSLERLPRVFGTDVESTSRFSILPQRVIDFTWISLFPYPTHKKNEAAIGKSEEETVSEL